MQHPYMSPAHWKSECVSVSEPLVIFGCLAVDAYNRHHAVPHCAAWYIAKLHWNDFIGQPLSWPPRSGNGARRV